MTKHRKKGRFVIHAKAANPPNTKLFTPEKITRHPHGDMNTIHIIQYNPYNVHLQYSPLLNNKQNMNILYGIIVCDILGTATATQAPALLRSQSTTNQLFIIIKRVIIM